MPDGPSIDFGRRITEHRKRLGWSVSEAARQLKVPRGSLSRWEHGHEMPCAENLIKIHEHLFMPISAAKTAQAPSGVEVGYQLTLPFDHPANLELRVVRKTPGSVQLEFRLKDLAG